MITIHNTFVQGAFHTLDRQGGQRSCHEDNGDCNWSCGTNIIATILFILQAHKCTSFSSQISVHYNDMRIGHK